MNLDLDHEFIINIKDDSKLSEACELAYCDSVSSGIVVKMDYLKNKGWQTPEICDDNIGKLSRYQEYWLNRYSKAHIIASKDADDVIQVFRVSETLNGILNECRRLQIPLIDEELFTDCVRAITEIHSKWILGFDDNLFHIDIYVIEASGRNDIQFQLLITAELRLYTDFAIELFSCEENNESVTQHIEKKDLLKVNLYDEGKFIGNCSNAAVFIYMNDEIVTPSAPLGSGVYSDLMRDSVITLLRSEGINVIEREISLYECISANKIGGIDEIFVTSIENGVQFVTQWQHDDHLFISKSAFNSGFLRSNIKDILCGKQEDLYRWVIYCNKHH